MGLRQLFASLDNYRVVWDILIGKKKNRKVHVKMTPLAS